MTSVRAAYNRRVRRSSKIISKIEEPRRGTDNIDSILKHLRRDGLPAASGSGDTARMIPMVKRTIIKKCVEGQEPVIVATQMLQSMIESEGTLAPRISFL